MSDTCCESSTSERKPDNGRDGLSSEAGAVLKVRYSGAEDILMYEVSAEPIDYAEEMGPVIVHFTRAGKPVLLEIQEASKFLTQTVEAKRRASRPARGGPR